MIAIALIHLSFGGGGIPLWDMQKIKFCYFFFFFFATASLWSKMIQLNMTKIWKGFPQCIYKYMVLKICSLKYFEQCRKNHHAIFYQNISFFWHLKASKLHILKGVFWPLINWMTSLRSEQAKDVLRYILNPSWSLHAASAGILSISNNFEYVEIRYCLHR